MGNEFVGERGGVDLDFNKVDGHGRNFGEEGSTQGIGKGQVNVFQREVSAVSEGLNIQLVKAVHSGIHLYLANGDSRTNVLEPIHSIVIHACDGHPEVRRRLLAATV